MLNKDIERAVHYAQGMIDAPLPPRLSYGDPWRVVCIFRTMRVEVAQFPRKQDAVWYLENAPLDPYYHLLLKGRKFQALYHQNAFQFDWKIYQKYRK